MQSNIRWPNNILRLSVPLSAISDVIAKAPLSELNHEIQRCLVRSRRNNEGKDLITEDKKLPTEITRVLEHPDTAG